MLFKKILLALFLLLTSQVVFGQEEIYFQEQETDSAFQTRIKYLESVLDTASLENQEEILYELNWRGSEEPEKVLEYAVRYLEVTQMLPNVLNILHAHTSLASTYYYDFGWHHKTLAICDTAMQLSYEFEKIDSLTVSDIEVIQAYRADYIFFSALVHRDLGENQRAKKLFFEALNIEKELGQYLDGTYHDIAYFYHKTLKQYDSAIYFYKKVFEHIEEETEGRSYKNIASTGTDLIDCYVQLGNIQQAKELLEYYEQEEKQPHYDEETKWFLKVTRVYILAAEKKYEEALSIFDTLSTKIKIIPPREGLDALKRMQNIAENAGDNERALKYAKLLLEKERDYFTTQKLNLTKAMEYEMDTKGKERTIATQQATISRSNQIIVFISVLIGLSLVIALILYRNFQTVKKKNHKIETLIKELHHRVKNNMQVVSSLLGLQSMRLEDGEVKEAVEEGRSRIKAMAMIHQKLYLKEDIAEVDVEDYLKQLLEELRTSFGLANLTIDTQIDKVKLDIDTVLPIGLIVNELVCNSFKHAFSEVESPNLQLSLQKKEGKMLQLSVRDNGKGLQAKEEKKLNESFGLRLVTILVKQLKGKLEMDTVQGLGYQISFQLR